MDRGVWQSTVCGVAKSQMQVSGLAHTYAVHQTPGLRQQPQATSSGDAMHSMRNTELGWHLLTAAAQLCLSDLGGI